ncbi:MAG: transglycosylase SLT domain-containing protein [Chloroflexi bacterium]|nr:transglycosylase SLT domain-containing protein [Chloroflexota bacterium]
MRIAGTVILALILAVTVWAAAAHAAPDPDELLLAAEGHRSAGNYPAALDGYRQAYDAASADGTGATRNVARTALYRMAQTYALDGRAPQALDTWTRFMQAYPDDARFPLAQLQLANSLRDTKNLPGAYLAYQAYRASASPDDSLLGYITLGLAQGYYDGGQYMLAAGEYSAALKRADWLPSVRVLATQRLGDALGRTGNFTDAISAYDMALLLAQTPATRSQLDVAAARALKELGRTDEAISRLKRVLSDTPSGDAAPQAVELLQTLAPKELSFFQAGLAYYYRRQYDAAVQWFHRALDEQGDPELAHYYAARSYELSNQQDRAIREWNNYISTHPAGSKLVEGMFERADDYWRIGQDATAIRLYQQLAADYPASTYAEDGLFAVGRIYEVAGKNAEAAKAYEALVTRYPSGARAAEALTAAGYMRYRANDLAGARATLERLAAYPDGAQKARGLFWLGKVLQKLGQPAEASARWMDAYRAMPADYYGLRAVDLAQSATPAGTERRSFALPAVFPGERLDMERWLRGWVDLSLDAPIRDRNRLSSMRVELSSDRRMVRGRLLLETGFRNEGRAELRDLADAYRDDAVAQYQLAIAFRELGLNDMSIRAGNRLLTLSNAPTTAQAPAFLQRLIYPAPFDPLVVQEAQKNGVDPLLMYGLMWQESQFDPYATSTAGARGLGQVMPGTGGDIARWLKRGDFKIDDLYKPYVSIEFGANYYARTLEFLDGDFMMALAGYNGGPGNAAKWKQADPDLAVEGITLSESRTYVKRVYQAYWFYRKLYGQPAGN